MWIVTPSRGGSFRRNVAWCPASSSGAGSNAMRVAARDLVQPLVGQHHRRPVHDRRVAPAALRALGAAHLEDVRVVGRKRQRQLGLDRRHLEVRHAQPLVTGAVPQELGAEHVQRTALDADLPGARLEIRVGQIDGEQVVLFLHRRRQQHRTPPAQTQLQPRQEPRPVVVDALLARPHRLHVAEAIEHRERLAVLEHARAVVGARRRRLDVEMLVQTDDLVVVSDRSSHGR